MGKVTQRINQLKQRKGELLSQMKALRVGGVGNWQHKADILNEQVMAIGAKIAELKGKINTKGQVEPLINKLGGEPVETPHQKGK